MFNDFTLVGRLSEIKEDTTEHGTKKALIVLAVPQKFKNVDGLYDTNYIDITIFGGIAENTLKYCKKGDVVGVRGRVQRLDMSQGIELIAEKLTFLSSKKEDE